MTGLVDDARLVVPAGLPVGLVLVRDAEVLGAEPFFPEFIAGLEQVLVPRGIAVLLQVFATVAQAMERLRGWVRDAEVQGVILIDLLPGDERVGLVKELGISALAISDPQTGDGIATVWNQDEVAMRDLVGALAAAGHSHVGHVAGPAEMAHTIIRRRTFAEAASEFALRTTSFGGDYSWAAGVRAVADVWTMTERPTALVFDNDVMALGGLAEAERLGLAVPEDLSLVAWDDSPQCQLASPSLSAVSHDVQALGVLAAETFLGVLGGAPPQVVLASPAHLVSRGSSNT
ncbi:MAG: LacI family transcriptional regulator [Bifidobacteriaceae bacterium]|jgi:DNA-binding LacI/PurR family transcriptional regulator|nr:LacI family transcriptional regulator [Bifidobacteriaceae bacterium]